MSKIYFVRHGESEWNVADKICGQTDIPLTQRGHEQAVMTGESFVAREIKADMILFSPLLRAADTAKHISDIYGNTGKRRDASYRAEFRCMGRNITT